MRLLFYVSCALLGMFLGNLLGHALRFHQPNAGRVTAPLPPQETGTIVRLVLDNNTYCSGAVVSDEVVITAGHCVITEIPFLGVSMNTNPIEIRASDNVPRQTYGKAIYYSPQLDHAIIKGNFSIYKKFKFIDDPAILTKIKDLRVPFTACGYPMGGELFCTVVTFNRTSLFMWKVNGILIPGMSGGPVLLPDGTEIGINDAVDEDGSIISPLYNIHRGMK